MNYYYYLYYNYYYNCDIIIGFNTDYNSQRNTWGSGAYFSEEAKY